MNPHEKPKRKLKLCLAASGGGHIRQLLDLEPAWRAGDVFFVSEDTSLAQSVAQSHRMHFVAHVALGQGRLGKPIKMLVAGIRNFIQSIAIVVSERPDMVITTGAGSVFFTVLVARLLGAKIVVVESFARFERLSAFARIVRPLAHYAVVQSSALSTLWPKAKVYDPLKILDIPRPPKRALLFATVGATLPFDRLVRSVAALKQAGEIPEEVLIQTGIGGHQPDGLATVETLPFGEILDTLKDADIVVCHGGTGSLITALREGCRVIAIPRRFDLGEHYDDHQSEITSAFAARGLIQLAHRPEDLSGAIRAAREMAPVLATSDPAQLIAYLQTLIAGVAEQRRIA